MEQRRGYSYDVITMNRRLKVGCYQLVVMGSELCSGTPDEELEKIDYNPDEERQDEEINKIIRKGEPSQYVGYNINQLPDFKKESNQLTELQVKITKLMAHEKRHSKPLKVTKNSNEKNFLPDPYYIRCLDAVYIGEWVLDKEVNQVVPGGLGRLYSMERIIEGEIMTKVRNGRGFLDQGGQDFSIIQQMVQHNKEKAIFFAIPKEEKPTVVAQLIVKDFQSDDFLMMDVMLHGEGRSFTRNTEERGVFVNGLLSGKGYCRIKEGEDVYEYTGQFRGGKKNGKGIQKYKLTSYDGDFQDDIKKGKGTLTLLINRTYDEQRVKQDASLALLDKESDPSAKIKKVKDFVSKRQLFENKLAEQLGKDYKWIPPEYPPRSMLDNQNFIIEHHRRKKFLEHYKGDFENNTFQGQGTYTWFNGKCYHGSWKEGQMDGIGEFYWPKGTIYRGQYEKDQRHGKGEMIWSLEKRFRGSWAYGLRHGYGELIQIDTQPDPDHKGKYIYFLRVKGALFNKDVLEHQYFNRVRQIDDLGLFELQRQQKFMIAFVKDIKIDQNNAE